MEITAAIIGGCFLILLWRLEKLAEKFVPKAPTAKVAPKERPPIPSRMIQYVADWQDKWASEDALARINELYDQTGSWEGVAASIEDD